ncbi:oxygen-dependent protoporphyrinogen oxidase [Aspergillus undulatus]|uniref:oxygen-dependent protoporphyrinogen oxidase n=1 Tax=Aspergillus undulatus TaxID=1810928 RepID=UPI003CCE2BA7
MRLPCASRYALKHLRKPLAFSRDGSRRCLHDSSKQYDVGIIGAGITGLTAAYRLTKDANCRKVTLYEKSPRVGGWIESERIKVDGGEIVFEYGPRTLRVAAPASFALLDLLSDLGLNDEILLTTKSSPAAQNRYIYYPDHLVRLPTFRKDASAISQVPGIIWTLLREPLFASLLWSLCTEPFRKSPKPVPVDESVFDYVSRRLSPEIANNLVSSVIHGIYAGDVEKLSADLLFKPTRDNERRKNVGILRTIISNARAGETFFPLEDLFIMELLGRTTSTSYRDCLRKLAKNTSTLTLKNGVGQLSETLATALKQSGKVEVLTDAKIKTIYQDDDTSDLTVEYEIGARRDSTTHNRLIATIPPDSLSMAFEREELRKKTLPVDTIRALSGRHSSGAVTTMVVNLYYPNPKLLPIRGFGYLIPRSISFAQNPERALGVIFASESSLGQDTASGTKLTVMMGGYYWDGWQTSDYPDHDTAVAMAQSLLKRHLGITDAPTIARTRLQRNAIPQPTVGHASRMQELSNALRQEFDNRVTVAGAWYSTRGTGVVDGIRQAYIAAAHYASDSNKAQTVPDLYKRWPEWGFPGGVVGAPIVNASTKPSTLYDMFW